MQNMVQGFSGWLSGATADACGRALRRAGAAQVDVLALARAVEPTANTLA